MKLKAFHDAPLDGTVIIAVDDDWEGCVAMFFGFATADESRGWFYADGTDRACEVGEDPTERFAGWLPLFPEWPRPG